MTGVSECSQQRGNLKDDGYKSYSDIKTTPLRSFVRKAATTCSRRSQKLKPHHI
ncbi:hypothetical protein [Photorhabdus sp. MH8.4]